MRKLWWSICRVRENWGFVFVVREMRRVSEGDAHVTKCHVVSRRSAAFLYALVSIIAHHYNDRWYILQQQ